MYEGKDEARKIYDKFMHEVKKFSREVRDDPLVRSYWENRSSTEPYDFVEELNKYGCDSEQTLKCDREQKLKENCVQQPVMLEYVNALQSKLLSIRGIVGDLRKSLIGGEPLEDTVEGRIDNVAYGISSCGCIADEIISYLVSLYGRIGDYGDK